MTTPDTAGAPWGAAVDDWLHFSMKLGLESDLLPVVSNPHARISERSKLRDLGKTPSRYGKDGHVVGIPKWTLHVATDSDVRRWSAVSDLGICLQTRVVRAIDIDIADPVAAQRVLDLIGLATALPMRRRENSGKCLLAFRMPGDFAKRIIRTEHGIIEFLATGQQFIAVGTHPSGVRYEWVDADGVIGLPGEVPELSPAEFEVLWRALVDTFALPDGESRARNGMMPTKPRVASDLLDPTVAWLDENGWVTGFERDGRVDVRCPWEGEHTGDSGPTATSYFPAGVGGFAQGHFRCLHAHCQGRTDGDFLEAVGYAASDFDVVDIEGAVGRGEVALPLPPFARDRAGRIEAELDNVVMAMHRPDLIGCEVGFDDFRAELMYGTGGVWRRFDDNDYTRLRLTLGRHRFKAVGPELMRDAVRFVASERRFDSAVNWARSLRWDGVPRVDTFYTDFFGVADTPYTRAVAAYTWTGLAARCLEPGAKCDMVPVFVGLQGAGKTTAVEALSPIDEAFVEINLERKDDDIARSLRGKLVGEIAELRGLQGRDAEAIKAWVSRTTEEWVGKWREFSSRFPRRLLMFGTTNQTGFLDDETGERRWLPMTVGVVDVKGVAAVRDQLWAEGVVRFGLEGVAWQDAYELAKAEHSGFKVSDPWEELIASWLNRDAMDSEEGPKRGDGPVRMAEVLMSALGLRADRMDRRAELRAGKVLRRLGYEPAFVRTGATTARAWRKKQ